MKTAIITGGDGFIGTHLTKHLINHGYEVFDVIIKGSTLRNKLEKQNNVHIIEADLNKYDEITDILPRNPDVFYHFAWAGVAPNQRTVFLHQMQNVELSLNAVRLAAAVHSGVFIFPGSTMEYVYYGKPINRDAIPSPSNAYGVAKISARYACSILCKQLGIPFIYTVISSIYSEDRNDNNVIYMTIEKLLLGEKPALTRLEQLWDYVVYGLQLIAEKGRPNAFYAIGHGDNWPLINYIQIIRDIINPELSLGIGEIKYLNNEIPCSCVDLNPIFEDTGFVPKISFDTGIRNVISEVKKRLLGEQNL